MTRGAWMHRPRSRFAPRVNDKPSADSESCQTWRLSSASLLLVAVLLSDHLWFCAGAEPTLDHLALMETGGRAAADRMPSASLHLSHSSLTRSGDDIFIGNSTEPFWPPQTCHPDSLSETCFTFGDAEPFCRGLSTSQGRQSADFDLSHFYLSFCDSYSLLDLFYGFSSLDNLSCSLDMVTDGDAAGCGRCLRAYQRYDRCAREKYEEFALLIQKYETNAYSVRTCMEECKMVYKSWLCSQYFQTTQRQCINRIPCKQYCLEVQKSCPFILPDNDDLIHGGSPSFICTGLLENHLSNSEAECCDVRWDFKPDNRSKGTVRRTHPSCHHKTSVTTSTASRLCNSRLKLCMLVLVLLHTISTLTVAQSSVSLDFRAVAPVEESSSDE